MSTRRCIMGALAGIAVAAAAHADTVLIGTQFSSILAYNTETGAATFRGFCAGPVHSMAVIGDTLYLGDDFGSVYSFDLNTNLLTGAFPVSVDATAMATDGEVLFIADSGGEIQKVDPQTGAVLDTLQTQFGQLTSLGVHWGYLYNGGLSTVAERASLFDDFDASSFDIFSVCGGAINSMTFSGIKVILGSTNGTIYRYDEFHGDNIGYYAGGTDSVGVAALTGNRLLIADSSGQLLQVDGETGDVLMETNVGEPIGALLALDVGAACPLDLDLSGILDLGDVQLFIMLFLQNRNGADLTGDGVLDIADVGEFVSQFVVGCP
ncbi:MAG: PQQ-binding-like beta-propeller repeat protein [Phycisphaeraceae bacterium]|nr:MAG: PQQ-binding-like beta-propeller repeat protein [Phycisphaeraceae bacterium]